MSAGDSGVLTPRATDAHVDFKRQRVDSEPRPVAEGVLTWLRSSLARLGSGFMPPERLTWRRPYGSIAARRLASRLPDSLGPG